MGINCCSNPKEQTDITITKPERNMTSTSQNPIVKNQKPENKEDQIEELKQSAEYSTVKSQPNILNNLENNENNIPALSQKEIDDIMNQIENQYQVQPQQKEVIDVIKEENKKVINSNINNNINNNVTPPI